MNIYIKGSRVLFDRVKYYIIHEHDVNIYVSSEIVCSNYILKVYDQKKSNKILITILQRED